MDERMLQQIDDLEFPRTEEERIAYRAEYLGILKAFGVTEEQYEDYLMDRLDYLEDCRSKAK